MKYLTNLSTTFKIGTYVGKIELLKLSKSQLNINPRGRNKSIIKVRM